MVGTDPRGIRAPLIRVGFCAGTDPDKEGAVFWATPSFAPDHVDDSSITEERPSESQVSIVFSSGSFHTLVRCESAKELDALMSEPLPGGCTSDKAEWARLVSTGDSESLCGPVVRTLQGGACVRSIDMSSKETHAFVNRLTNAMLWFIDGCTAIAVEDGTRWRLFTLWRDHELVGAATAFVFLVPVRRLRICQFFVSPQQQRQGFGAHLLDAIFEAARCDAVVEVNVEDQSAGFRALRDFVDARRAVGLRVLIESSEDARMPSAAQLREAQAELLLTNDQVLRVAEILRLRRLDEIVTTEAVATGFRLECKKRLLKLNEERLGALEVDERKRKLAELFDETATAYRSCARKLK